MLKTSTLTIDKYIFCNVLATEDELDKDDELDGGIEGRATY